MSIEYSMDGKVEPVGIWQSIRDCHQRLAAVIDNIPDDQDGDSLPAAAVIEEVFAFLGALAQELKDWSDHRFVQIEEGLHGRLWALCREQEKAHPDWDIEAEFLLRAVVDTALENALAKPIDFRAIFDRCFPLRRRLKSEAQVDSDLLNIKTPADLQRARKILNGVITQGIITEWQLYKLSSIRTSAIAAVRKGHRTGKPESQYAVASVLMEAIHKHLKAFATEGIKVIAGNGHKKRPARR